MKFLDVKTDYAFKKVFGSLENKDILIDFLNSVIDFEKDNKIVDLMIVDPYNIPMLKGMKDTYVDVKAELQDKSKIIIEMQVLNHEGFEKRILYNAAKNYSIQLHKKEDYQLLNPVIALTIVDFIMFEETDKIITNFKMIEKDDFINYNDDIELIFIELPKFNKTLDNLQGIQEQWLYFIKNAGSLEYIPKKLNKPIIKALEVVNEANFTEEELELQYKRKEFISIQRLAVLKAKNDGLKQGIEQGIQEGIEKGKEDIAISLFDVLDIDIISKKTGLSIERLNQLKEAHSKQS